MRCKSLAPKQKTAEFVSCCFYMGLFVFLKVGGPARGLLLNVRYSTALSVAASVPTNHLDTAKESENGFDELWN